MSLRSRSRVKSSMSLTNLFVHKNYIRSHINIILTPILLFWTGLEPNPRPTACVSRALAN